MVVTLSQSGQGQVAATGALEAGIANVGKAADIKKGRIKTIRPVNGIKTTELIGQCEACRLQPYPFLDCPFPDDKPPLINRN